MAAHTTAQYDFVESLSTRLGLDFHGRDFGTLRLAADLPVLASGSIQADYTLRRAGKDYELFSKELKAIFSDIQGQESLSLKDIGAIVT